MTTVSFKKIMVFPRIAIQDILNYDTPNCTVPMSGSPSLSNSIDTGTESASTEGEPEGSPDGMEGEKESNTDPEGPEQLDPSSQYKYSFEVSLPYFSKLVLARKCHQLSKHTANTKFSNKISSQNGKRGRPYSLLINARLMVYSDLQSILSSLHKSLYDIHEYDMRNIPAVCNPPSSPAPTEQDQLLESISRLLGCSSSLFDSHVVANTNFRALKYDCKNNSMSFLQYMDKIVQSQKYKFVKTIRDYNGKLVKLEIIDKPNFHSNLKNMEWLKEHACFPRYKANMKIHVMLHEDTQDSNSCAGDDSEILFYNEPRLFLHDLIYNNYGISKEDVPDLLRGSVSHLRLRLGYWADKRVLINRENFTEHLSSFLHQDY
ncbi:BA75_04457T0 [Komagataella pastoris]|uniref:BA75_04457T0 n=1 Tax=Komagataella pastoris TaxID=4922 RepID=A0A1B2JJE9_PICPA|nr:BA75_04457T0 [Komagataella pastoris]